MRVGAAALNQHLFDWAVSEGWHLPAEPIMMLMTYGGTTSNVCHGGGINHPPVSDFVTEVEYVDADGEVRDDWSTFCGGKGI